MKTLHHFLTIAFSVMLALTSCQEEPHLSVNPVSVSFESNGGVQYVNVSANYPWTASVSGSGFTISPSSGDGDSPISITATKNASQDENKGEITIKCEGLTTSVVLSQKASSMLIMSGGTITVPYEGGSYSTDIQYNVDYTVTVSAEAQNWIKVVRTKSLETGTLELSFEPNDSPDARSGKVAVQAQDFSINPVVITVNQEANPIYKEKETNMALSLEVLKEIYDSMDGEHWDFQGKTKWFSTEYPSEWAGIWFNGNYELIELNMQNFGLKGELPESIGKLTGLEQLFISDAGITGAMPESMSNLTNLNYLRIQNTSMTSLTDIFSERMKNLEWVEIGWNSKMEGPVPVGLAKLPAVQNIRLEFNALTGVPDASLAPLHIDMSGNRLSGPVSDEYFKDYDSYKGIISQQPGYGFDLSKYDLAGGYPMVTVPDIISGEDIDFQKLVSESKYTVYLFWAPWCPFSKSLMPQLTAYYKKYHQDGLEIVATVTISDEVGPYGNLDWDDREGQIKEINDMGYGIWYNFFFPDFREADLAVHPYDSRVWSFASTPTAEVYDSKGNIVFSSSQYDDPVRNRFNKPASTDLIPFLESAFGPIEEKDEYESKDYSADGKVLTLQKASKGKGIDIVFLGDGYTDRDMGAGGLYETVMKESMEEFFAIEPYRTFRDRFNVYAVKAVSKNGRTGEGYDTAFSTSFGKGTEVNGNTVKAFEYASKAVSSTDNMLVCVMVNSLSHKGTNIMFEGRQSSVAWTSTYGNDRQYFGSTLRHEAGGHGFGFLADEYVTYSTMAVPGSAVTDFENMWKKYGWYANVDFTNDPAMIKWSAFLSDERYKDETGIYEGAVYYASGAYRPSKNSMMNENMEYFNAPSRLAIYKRIMELSGEEYSFEKFIEYDEVNRKATKAVGVPYKAAARSASRPWEPSAPPVVMP
ncbi:MAG: M64 family metallopeptidase [Bacteroidia bacterium]|nr:M64 family metallopeptidase [Bacteroidia bacterium]